MPGSGGQPLSHSLRELMHRLRNFPLSTLGQVDQFIVGRGPVFGLARPSFTRVPIPGGRITFYRGTGEHANTAITHFFSDRGPGRPQA